MRPENVKNRIGETGWPRLNATDRMRGMRGPSALCAWTAPSQPAVAAVHASSRRRNRLQPAGAGGESGA
jgi:hypothetical protein